MEVEAYMSPKVKAVWVCLECGYESPKWNGQCPACGEWNTFNEEIRANSKQAGPGLYIKNKIYE